MAGIDKTYCNYEQYKQVIQFFTKEMKAKQKQDLGFYFGYAQWNKKDFGNLELPLWNTPSLVDLWLAQNCKLDFVQERLKEQYSNNWIGWRDLDFSERGFLISAEYKKSYVAPFKKDREYITTYDEVLVYGTTFAHKFLNNCIALIRSESYNNTFIDSFIFKVEFELFGLHLKAISSLGKTIYYIGDEEVEMPYLPCYIGKDPFNKFFEVIKIKHSYNRKDLLKYEPEQIIMSDEDSCINVDMYKNFSKEQYNRYLSMLPKYIKISGK